MTHPTKTILTTVTATLALALAITNATANRLRISDQGFRVTWASLEFTNTTNTNSVFCSTTLEGSFHSATISKVMEALVGYVSRASVNGGSCTGGTVSVLGERLPWHIRYRGFSGTLPTITQIRFGLIGDRWAIKEPGAECRATTETVEPVIVSIAINSGVAEAATPERNTRITLEGGFLGACGLGRGAFGGTSSTLTVLGTTTRITVTLI